MQLAEQVRCGVGRGVANCTVAPFWSRAEHYPQFYQEALSSFLEYLMHYPEDVSARWLANVSAQALGLSPDAIARTIPDGPFLAEQNGSRNQQRHAPLAVHVGGRAILS